MEKKIYQCRWCDEIQFINKDAEPVMLIRCQCCGSVMQEKRSYQLPNWMRFVNRFKKMFA